MYFFIQTPTLTQICLVATACPARPPRAHHSLSNAMCRVLYPLPSLIPPWRRPSQMQQDRQKDAGTQEILAPSHSQLASVGEASTRPGDSSGVPTVVRRAEAAGQAVWHSPPAESPVYRSAFERTAYPTRLVPLGEVPSWADIPFWQEQPMYSCELDFASEGQLLARDLGIEWTDILCIACMYCGAWRPAHQRDCRMCKGNITSRAPPRAREDGVPYATNDEFSTLGYPNQAVPFEQLPPDAIVVAVPPAHSCAEYFRCERCGRFFAALPGTRRADGCGCSAPGCSAPDWDRRDMWWLGYPTHAVPFEQLPRDAIVFPPECSRAEPAEYFRCERCGRFFAALPGTRRTDGCGCSAPDWDRRDMWWCETDYVGDLPIPNEYFDATSLASPGLDVRFCHRIAGFGADAEVPDPETAARMRFASLLRCDTCGRWYDASARCDCDTYSTQLFPGEWLRRHSATIGTWEREQDRIVAERRRNIAERARLALAQTP